ncbi:hypothetical protein [Endozoicomonas sp. ALB091]|uniref:hypothetical protein n=1 Tax=Endozoicomonas sp. ALB091 TaxID=3403073 RepID=UPI003BB6A1F8
MDDKDNTIHVKLTMKVSQFEDEAGTEGVEYKMLCKVGDAPENPLFEVIADASMYQYNELFREHLGNLAQSLVEQNMADGIEKVEKQQAAEERVRLELELH